MSTAQTQQTMQGKYRPEIDGIRAFAVTAVIINHLNKGALPGGYLGVDIFFVVSGYVITSSLHKRPSKDFKDFISSFYERRIKRLAPALLVFTLITSVAICLFNPSPDQSLGTGISSLLGLSNLYLIRQSADYFAEATELNSFAHTWSLGVEEQFYILFPFLIWFSGFARQTKNCYRNLTLAVGGLTAASLSYFLHLYPVNQLATYFLMPTRFWEMAAGCLVFVGVQKRASLERALEKVPPLLALALIIGVMYLPRSLANASTIGAVALTSVLITSLKKKTLAFSFFTNPKVVYVGLISYSLYLWHWGVLSISRWTIGIHWWSVPFQIALMVGLAIISYRWIETPCRKSHWLGKRWKNLAIGGVAMATLSGGLLVLRKPLEGKLFVGTPAKEMTPLTFDGKSVSDSCVTISKDLEQIARDCTLISAGDTSTLWLVGDSHGEAMLFAASEIARRKNMSLVTYFYYATPFPSTPNKAVIDKNVLSASRLMAGLEMQMLEKFRNGDIVIIGMRYPYHFKKGWYETPLAKDSEKRKYFSQWMKNLEAFALKASDHNVSIIISTPTPEFPYAAGKPCHGVDEQWFNQLSRQECGTTTRDSMTGAKGYYNSINTSLQAVADRTNNVYLFDAFSKLCPQETCNRLLKNKSLYRDDDHISNHGSKEVILPALDKFIRESDL